jgi:Fe2+ transport system protein B
VLEASGYMVRAAFLMDRLMAASGLSGRAFIPLLSSFACAVPGIMATRTIDDEKDRLTTILIAPLMTCSARLPVYTLIIGAFIPNAKVCRASACRARPVRPLSDRHRRRDVARRSCCAARDQGAASAAS